MRVIAIALSLISIAAGPALATAQETADLSSATQTTSSLNDAPTVKLTLQECLEIALSENPTIKVADLEVQRLDYSKKETIGQLLPSISFGANYNRMIAKQVAYMNMSNFPGLGGGGSTESAEPESRAGKGDTGIKMGLDNSYSLGFSATLPLIAPQLWKTLKLNDSQILESVETARSSRLQLVNQVKSAYYALLLTTDSYKVLLESYDMAKFTADLYERQFAAGAASEFDVLRAKVAMQNIEPDLLQAEIAMKQAKLQLLILMGMDATINIEAADQLSNYEGTVYETALNINRSDISGNSDLRLLDIKAQQLDNALSIKRAAWYPTLALVANYNWTSSSNGNPFADFRWDPYSVVGLSFNLPIFQGGQRYYSIQETKLQIEEMGWQRENLTRAINTQVDLALDNINKNINQISSTTRTVAQAEKAHDIMKRSFEIGAASYLNLRDSELALTQSKLAHYQSIYNYLIACSELELLLGNADIGNFIPAK